MGVISDSRILHSFRNGQLPLKMYDLRSLCQCKSLSSVNMLEGSLLTEMEVTDFNCST